MCSANIHAQCSNKSTHENRLAGYTLLLAPGYCTNSYIKEIDGLTRIECGSFKKNHKLWEFLCRLNALNGHQRTKLGHMRSYFHPCKNFSISSPVKQGQNIEYRITMKRASTLDYLR